MICHERNLCFVHIPKCGGTSIEKALFPDHRFTAKPDYEHLFGWDPKFGQLCHLTLDEMRGLSPEFFAQNPTVFSVVRNPWDRLVSEYAWKRLHKVARITFSEFVRLLHRKAYDGLVPLYRSRASFWQHVRPQVDFIKGYIFANQARSFYEPVRILRFENLAQELADYMLDIGQQAIHIGRERASSHLNFAHYYCKETARMVHEMYRGDVTRFGYEVPAL